MTPALSSKYRNTPSFRRYDFRCRITTAGCTRLKEESCISIHTCPLIQISNTQTSPSQILLFHSKTSMKLSFQKCDKSGLANTHPFSWVLACLSSLWPWPCHPHQRRGVCSDDPWCLWRIWCTGSCHLRERKAPDQWRSITEQTPTPWNIL